MAQFYTLKVLSLLVYIFELISCREIDHSSPSLAIECNKDNPCPETQKCVIGECRETLSDFNPNCEYNCNVTDPICASNGKDFNSHCEMERENCLHGLEVYAECHEECPCEFDLSKSSQRCEFETTKEKVSAYFHQRSSKDFAELLLSADNLPKLFLSYVHQQCQYSAKWAFSVLDFDRSGFVEEKEIIDLYLTFNDPCVVEMVSQCDLNQNGMLSFVEWCYCFRDGQPTCDKVSCPYYTNFCSVKSTAHFLNTVNSKNSTNVCAILSRVYLIKFNLQFLQYMVAEKHTLWPRNVEKIVLGQIFAKQNELPDPKHTMGFCLSK